MAIIISYGVGTAWTESGITGEKSEFSQTETAYAEHVWDESVKGDTFTILLQRKVAGEFVTARSDTWTNEEGFESIYHYYSFTPRRFPGKWRAVFQHPGAADKFIEFTVTGSVIEFHLYELDEVTPIPNVTVTFKGDRAISNDRGLVLMWNAPSGTGEVTFEKEGYQTLETEITVPENDAYIETQHLQPLVIEIRRIYGVVKDINTHRGKLGVKVTFGKDTVMTDRLGRFEIIDPDFISGPITFELAGYETLEKMITSPVTGTLFVYPYLTPEEIIPEKTWWEKLLEILTIPWQIEWLKEKALFAAAYKAFTGNDLTDEEYVRTKAEILDWILPINLTSILFYGKNLKGEAVEFTDTETMIELAALALMITPFRFIGKLGSKIGLKIGGKGVIKVAGRMGLKKATPEAIEAMIKSGNYEWIFKAARTAPTEWAKLAPKLSAETQAIISAGLKKAHPNAAYRLFEEAILNSELAKRSFTTKTIDFVRKHKALGIVSVLGGIWGIIGFEAFTNWPLADNLGFLEYKSAEAVEEAYERTDLTREEALEELDKIIVILQGAYDKIKVSASWNPLMIAFGAPFVLIAKENLALAIRTRERIAELPPVKPKGILTIRPVPTDAKVSVSGQIPTTGVFSAELDIGIYSVTVSKFGYVSRTKSLEVLEDEETTWDVELVIEEETANISVISEPETGADVFIDDNLQPFKTNTTFENIPLGKHTITIYKAPFGNIVYDVSPEKIDLDLTEVGVTYEARFSLTSRELPPDTGNISVTSSPTGASIWINDVLQTFKTNTVIEDYPVGPVEVRIEKEGYEKPDSISETLEPGEVQPVDFGVLIPLPVEKGKLIIDVSPGDVDVYAAGVFKFHIDETGHYEEELDPAGYSYVFKKDGYYDITKNFYITSLEETPLAFSLTELPVNIGYLSVTTAPPGVDVSIALGYLGTTDEEGKATFDLLPGYYMVTFGKTDYDTKVVTTYINKGETREIDVTLNPSEIPEDYYPPDPYYPVEPPPYIYPTPPDYSFLYPQLMEVPGLEPFPAPVEKELLVNIETTDAKPWKGRIYSIAFLDLTKVEEGMTVLVDDNEEKLIEQFWILFNGMGFKKLVGFKLTFDHRYIFNKFMQYRMQNKEWAEIDLKDVKQLMDQVKEEFVYFPDRTGTLDDYGKSLLGKGKYGTQKEILQRFLAKDFDYVKAFQQRQIEITYELYQLYRFSSSEALISPIPTVPEAPVPGIEPSGPESTAPPATKICPECKQENPVINTECFICGRKF